MPNHPILTLGYSAWSPAQLATLVTDRDAQLLDIRYSPKSMRPEWRRDALRSLLGSRYLHVPALGNRNYNTSGPIELAAPDRAVEYTARLLATGPVVLMCACRNWTECHRAVAADYLSERLGAPVEHLEPPVVIRKKA